MNEETMVLIALSHEFSPVEPHRPGTYILGYLPGTRDNAHETLNRAKTTGTNILVYKAWLLQVGLAFVPESENSRRLSINNAAFVLPLTRMDCSRGVTYGVPPTIWAFPEGTMQQDLEAEIEKVRTTLVHQRSGITQAH